MTEQDIKLLFEITKLVEKEVDPNAFIVSNFSLQQARILLACINMGMAEAYDKNIEEQHIKFKAYLSRTTVSFTAIDEIIQEINHRMLWSIAIRMMNKTLKMLGIVTEFE